MHWEFMFSRSLKTVPIRCSWNFVLLSKRGRTAIIIIQNEMLAQYIHTYIMLQQLL